MALDYEATYGPGGTGQWTAANANYVNGEPKDVLTQNDGTGAPWEALLISDYIGYLQAVILEAGITRSGTSDTSIASQYLDAVKVVIPREFTTGHKQGLRIVQNAAPATVVTLDPGGARNQADTIGMTLPAEFEKDLGVVWVEGDANGGLAPDLTAIAADTWYRMFLIRKTTSFSAPVDVVIDTDVAAANFYSSGAAAGWDSTLYRRIAWVRTDSSADLRPFVNLENNTNKFLWTGDFGSRTVISTNITGGAARTALDISEICPINVEGLIQYLFTQVISNPDLAMLLSPDSHPDLTVTNFNYTAITRSALLSRLDLVEIDSGPSSSINWRVDGALAFNSINLVGRGWLDNVQSA